MKGLPQTHVTWRDGRGRLCWKEPKQEIPRPNKTLRTARTGSSPNTVTKGQRNHQTTDPPEAEARGRSRKPPTKLPITPQKTCSKQLRSQGKRRQRRRNQSHQATRKCKTHWRTSVDHLNKAGREQASALEGKEATAKRRRDRARGRATQGSRDTQGRLPRKAMPNKTGPKGRTGESESRLWGAHQGTTGATMKSRRRYTTMNRSGPTARGWRPTWDQTCTTRDSGLRKSRDTGCATQAPTKHSAPTA